MKCSSMGFGLESLIIGEVLVPLKMTCCGLSVEMHFG